MNPCQSEFILADWLVGLFGCFKLHCLSSLLPFACPSPSPGCAPGRRMLCGSPIHCSLLAFVISTLVFQVPQGHSAPLTVTGPPGPITVAKGEDVVLPCSFSPGQNAQDTEVTWFREQFLPFVHRYKLGQDQFGEQMVQYQGRTELWKDGLAKGSADLRIFHVQLSDRGSYTCFVQRGSDYDEAVVELKVTASGSAPLIALERYEHGGIRVACRSAGWYPRPRVLWHDPHGRHLPSLSENATQDKNGLFAAESSIILTRAGTQELSCSVQHLPHTPGQGPALYVSGESRMGHGPADGPHGAVLGTAPPGPWQDTCSACQGHFHPTCANGRGFRQRWCRSAAKTHRGRLQGPVRGQRYNPPCGRVYTDTWLKEAHS
ncbi:butyrophilin-like protein 10 isoform X4 [Pseudopipra pipra]|uniref:butyrophilin-like protein 10 isoform X4 n=1 Tax=Pseudopipra pipra TaxID=415032 RepID=UPI003138E6D8